MDDSVDLFHDFVIIYDILEQFIKEVMITYIEEGRMFLHRTQAWSVRNAHTTDTITLWNIKI